MKFSNIGISNLQQNLSSVIKINYLLLILNVKDVLLNLKKIFTKHDDGNKEEKTNGQSKKQFMLLGGIIFLIACLGFIADGWSESLPVARVRVVGNNVLAPDEIISLLDSSIYSTPKESLSLLEISEPVEEHPYVAKAFVMFEASDGIVIEINEKIPEAYIVHENGKSSYVDKHSNILPFRFIQNKNDLPLFMNMTTYGDINKDAVSGALKILNELKSDKDGSVFKMISEIIWNADSESFTLRTSDNGIIVLFGRAENIREKMDYFYSWHLNEQPNLKIHKIRYIDLRWDGQLVVNSK